MTLYDLIINPPADVERVRVYLEGTALVLLDAPVSELYGDAVSFGYPYSKHAAEDFRVRYTTTTNGHIIAVVSELEGGNV